MLIALVTGNIIGSGAFLLPSDLAKFGSIGILSLVATSLGAIALALIFARMSKLVKEEGGPYTFIKVAFGDNLGIQMAYAYWLAIWVGNAAVIVAALGYLDLFIPVMHNIWARNLVALGILWSLTWINCLNLKAIGWCQIIMTVLKFVPLLVVMIGGWYYFHPEWLAINFNVSGHGNYRAFSEGLIFTMWLFLGIESATIPADNVENPERNIPLATILGTLLAMAVYLIGTLVVFGMIPNRELVRSSAPFALASQLILGDWGKYLVAMGALIACIGSLNGWILISVQIPVTAAKQKIFPAFFGKTNAEGTPVNAIITNSVCVSVLLLGSSCLNLINQFDFLILLATAISILAYFYTCIAHFKLSGYRFFRQHWGWMLINLVAFLYSGYILISADKWLLISLITLSSLATLFIWVKTRKGSLKIR